MFYPQGFLYTEVAFKNEGNRYSVVHLLTNFRVLEVLWKLAVAKAPVATSLKAL
jgi:hypothetical protein